MHKLAQLNTDTEISVVLQEERSTQNEQISALKGQLEESRAKMSSLEAECGEKRDETDKLRHEIDRLSRAQNVSRV